MPFFAFFLKGVQHIHHTGKTHGLNGPVGVAVEIVDQFQNSTAAESFQRLCSYWLIPLLHLVQRVPNAILVPGRESFQVLKARANKDAGLQFGPFVTCPNIEISL